MNQEQPYTLSEITTQALAWEESVNQLQTLRTDLTKLWREGFDRLIYTGCGSTHYISNGGAVLTRQLAGVHAYGYPASDLLLNPDTVYYQADEKLLLIASSRSGRTTETLRAVEQFRRDHTGKVITISNYPDAPLATMGDVNIVIPAGREEGIAQTRSFASMYIAHTGLSALFAARDDFLDALLRLPNLASRLLEKYATLAREIGSNLDIEQVFYLGSGPRRALASELSLKLKELSLTISEPFHFLEYRHGPASMVNHRTMIIGLLSEASRQQEEAVLTEMRELGAQVITVGETNADISFESGLPEAVRGVLYLPVFQLMAYYRSVSKGLDPDNLTNLVFYVEATL